MQRWLNFIEQYSVDDELYWQLNQGGTNVSFEIQWRRAQAMSWRIKPLHALFWTQCDRDGLLLALQREQLNLSEFEDNLRRTVVQQAVFGHAIFNAAKELVDEATLKEALTDHNEFMEQLRSSVDMMLAPADSAEIIQPAPVQRLRIVRDRIGE